MWILKNKDIMVKYNRGVRMDYNDIEEYYIDICKYSKKIEENPKNKEWYFHRGNIYAKFGEYKKAIKDYIKAIEIDGNYTVAYLNRGLAYYSWRKKIQNIDNVDEAKVLAKDIKYNGEDLKDFKKKLYDESKNYYDYAINDYDKVISLDEKHIYAYNNKGIINFERGQFEEAEKNYNKAIEIDSKCKEAYNNKGNLYLLQNKYEEAKESYGKVVEIDPHYKLSIKNTWSLCNVVKDNRKIQDKIRNKYRFLKIYFSDKKLYKYIDDQNFDEKTKALIGDLYEATMELKENLAYTNENQLIYMNNKKNSMVAHYTKVENLKFLFKPKELMSDKDKPKPRLRIYNVSYMNDPTEGQVFSQLLKMKSNNEEKISELLNNLYGNLINDEREEVLSGKNRIFLLSFSEAIDLSLPMWVQYSNNGEGCCIVLSTSMYSQESIFDVVDRNSISNVEVRSNDDVSDGSNENMNESVHYKKDSYVLYKVMYLDLDKNFKEELIQEKLLNIVLSKIDEISKYLLEFDSSEIKSNQALREIIINILDQVRFLFKSKDYAHEKEVRIVKYEDNGNIKYTTEAEGYIVPHTYINLDRELIAEEVILGPRVTNAVEIANYLLYTGKVKKVTKSHIKYQ